jgi:hypothetical protein
MGTRNKERVVFGMIVRVLAKNIEGHPAEKFRTGVYIAMATSRLSKSLVAPPSFFIIFAPISKGKP